MYQCEKNSFPVSETKDIIQIFSDIQSDAEDTVDDFIFNVSFLFPQQREKKKKTLSNYFWDSSKE